MFSICEIDNIITDYPSYINNKYTNKLLEKHSVFQYREYHFYHSIYEQHVVFVAMNCEEYLGIDDVLFEYLNQNIKIL